VFAAATTVGALVAGVFATFYGGCVLALITYTVVDPWMTGVQLQRRLTAEDAYEKHYEPRPLSALDEDLPRAVVAAEDTRFFQHHGIDWKAIGEAIEENWDGDAQRRGGSTITQQLVKNLFLTTHSTYLRKALELPLTYLAELILSKRRILELYLSVIEWGPGIYGAEAAAQYHYDQSAAELTRYQAAALAACVPNPLVRRPMQMDWYTRIILRRMEQLGPIQPHLETSLREGQSPPTTPRSSRESFLTIASIPSAHGH
jgi:monofunctional biosynthetic peptidoglycan transglycosylase